MADAGDDPQEVHSGTHSPAAESKSGTPLKAASRSKVTLLGSNQDSPDPGFGSGQAPSDMPPQRTAIAASWSCACENVVPSWPSVAASPFCAAPSVAWRSSRG